MLLAMLEKAEGLMLLYFIGDVKGCGPLDADFPSAATGEILDMASDLLKEHQFTRDYMYCFLTDGYKFQFFKCIRADKDLTYEQSEIYVGVKYVHVCVL